MANFRFISYLYEYKKEVRGRNTGFVRVRGLNDFIELNMQVKPAKGTYEVYVHYETLPEVKSILIGTIRAVNGECHGIFRNILPGLRREGLSFSAIEALTIWQEDVICHGTEWTESNCLKRLLSEKGKKENKEWIQVDERENEEVKDIKENNVEAYENTKEERKEKNIEEMMIDIKEAEKKKITTEETNGDFKVTEVDKRTIEEMMDEFNEIEMSEQTIEKSVEEEFKSDLGWPKPKNIEELMLQLKTIPSFGNDSFLKCVKIMPKDIGLLHADDWYLGKNSFLLHGYFAYQYLMLGYIRFQDGGKQAVLGVPGVYNSKDKYLAELFGFTNFIQAKEQEIKTGTFGYWITSVHENIGA